jgi:hypothetical protein
MSPPNDKHPQQLQHPHRTDIIRSIFNIPNIGISAGMSPPNDKYPQHLQHPHRRDVGTLCIASETHKAKVTYKYYKGFFQQKTTEKSPKKQKKKIFFAESGVKRRKAKVPKSGAVYLPT